MKKLSIYEVYVLMQNQEQCNRMKQLCIDNGLPIWKVEYSFDFLHNKEVFGFDSKDSFFIMDKLEDDSLKTQVTESEFIELLKTTK